MDRSIYIDPSLGEENYKKEKEKKEEGVKKEEKTEIKKEKAYKDFGRMERFLLLSGALLSSFIFQVIFWLLNKGQIPGVKKLNWNINWDAIIITDIIFVGIILSFAGTLLLVHRKPTSHTLVYFINFLFVAIPLVIILVGIIDKIPDQKKTSVEKIKVCDFREFKIGEVFEMQGMRAGDSNGFYIRQPMGKPSWRFVASYATGIKAVLRDGREFDIKHKSNLPDGDYDFKIVAYEDGARVKVWFENPR